MAAMGIVIELAQMLALIMGGRFVWQTDVVALLKPILTSTLLTSLLTGWRTPTILSLAWFMNLALLVGVIQVRIQIQWAVKTLRFGTSMLTSVLFIPIVHAFVMAVISCSDCSSIATLSSRIVTLLALGVFVLVTALMTISNFEVAMESSASLARPHSRVELFYDVLYRVVFVTVADLDLSATASVFILGALSALTAFLYLRYLPYYRLEFVFLRASTLAILTWACICLLIGIFQGSPESVGPIAAFLSCVPIVVLAAYVLVRTRRAHIERQPRESLQNCFEIELQARFLLQEMLRESERKQALGEHYDSEAVLDQVRGLYDDSGSARFRDSSMFYWFRARFMFEFVNNIYLGYNDLERADMLGPPPDIQFLIYRQRTLSMDLLTTNTGIRDINAYIFGEVHSAQAISFDLHAVNIRVGFWSELCKAVPDLDAIPNLSLALRSATASAAFHYETAIKLKRTDPFVLLRYLQFVSDTEGESSSSYSVLRGRLQELQRAHTDQDTKKLDSALSSQISANRIKQALTWDDNAIVVVSVSDEHFGQIERVNLKFKSVFGFTDSDLIVGRPIDIIIPEPFVSVHDQISRRRLGSNTHTLLQKSERVLVARHRSGSLFRISILLRMFTELGARLSIIAFITPLRTPEGDLEDVPLALVRQSDGHLHGTSTGFATLFAVRDSTNRNIANYIPDYFLQREQMHQPDGCLIVISGFEYRATIDTRIDYGLGADLVVIEPVTAMSRDATATSFFVTNSSFRKLLYAESEGSVTRSSRRVSSEDALEEDSDESVADAAIKDTPAVPPPTTAQPKSVSDSDETRTMFLSNLDIIRRRELGRRPPIGLQRIRQWSALFTIFVAVLVLVLVAYINSSVLDQFVERTARIAQSGTKRLAMVTLSRSVHRLEMQRIGIIPPDDIAWQELRHSAETLLDIDTDIGYDAFHSSSQYLSMFGDDLNVSESVGDQYIAVQRNLFDIDLLTVTRARRIDSVADLSRSTIDINEILRTSLGDVATRMHDTIVLYRTDATGQVSEILGVARGVCIAIAFITLLVCGLIIRPTIAEIESLRNRIATQFFKIPLPDVKSFLSKAASRADALRHTESDSKSERARTKSMSVAGDIKHPGDRLDSDLQSLLQAARRRRAQNVVRFASRLAAPYAVILVLVLTLWYSMYSPLTSALITAPANLQLSTDRTYAARYTLLMLHVLATPGTTYLTATPDQVQAGIDQFLSLHNALTYGSSSMSVTGTVYVETNQDSLLYESACLQNAAPGCTTFAHGILTSGLHTAVLEYADLCRVTLHKIRTLCVTQSANCTRVDIQTQLLNLPELRQLNDFDRLYLFPALRQSEADFNATMSAAQLSLLRQNVILIIAGFVALTAFVYWRLYRPTLERVLQHSLQVRAMLSVVPDQIRLPGLEQLVNDHVRKL